MTGRVKAERKEDDRRQGGLVLYLVPGLLQMHTLAPGAAAS
jgi:hypothetical protein